MLINHWINGSVDSEGGSLRTVPLYDPARGVETGSVVLGTPADLDRAVSIARDAGARWAGTSLAARTRVLFAFRERLSSRRHELAEVITAQHGKVLSDAAGEIARGVDCVEFACGVPHLLKGEHSRNVSTGIDVHSVREPVGVIAGITPFNFPAMVPLWMCPIAIAAGNAFILKPSEKDPGASMLLAEMWQEAGLPDGVFNVIHGDATVVDAILRHDGIAAVSFVGSTPVARHVYEVGTSSGKRVQALGGAKNHMVVLADADVGVAADAAVSAAYGSAGERCMAVSVLVPVGDVAGPLVEAVAERAARLVVGPGSDPETDMGPLVTAAHRDAVAGHVADAVAEGAAVVLDGRDHVEAGQGFFLGPSLLDDVTPTMRCYREEIFGPVLSVVRVADADDALALVNANPYGNGVALFTRDGGAARRFEAEVQVGMVGMNVPIPVPVGYHSFGGWKASLFGGHHMYGTEGLAFATRTKVVTSRWPDPATSQVDLGFPRVE